MIDQISLLEQEVQEEANEFNIELIFRLIDKLENLTHPSPNDLFKLYVALKIARHHLKKRHNQWWYEDVRGPDHYYVRLRDLNNKIHKARRDYYVGIKEPERIAKSERRDWRNTRP